MFVHVKAYYNRETHYTTGAITQIVGSAMVALPQAPTDEEVCAAVFALLNGARIDTELRARLFKVCQRQEREHLRSMRVGDLVTVWTAERADDCAQERIYEVRPVGFQRVDREPCEA